MLEKVWRFRHFKMEFWSWTICCSMNCLNQSKHAWIRGGKRSHVTLRCCWKWKVLLSTHVKVSRRKGCWSTINLVPKYFFLKIWQYHSHFLFESYGICTKKITNNFFIFLGYTFDVQNKIIPIQTKMLEELFETSLINKKLCYISWLNQFLFLAIEIFGCLHK
jgi:hypothetical protein